MSKGAEKLRDAIDQYREALARGDQERGYRALRATVREVQQAARGRQ